MRIDVLTIFPQLIDSFASEGLLGKTRTNGIVDLRLHDLRDETDDPHRSVDDAPFGGGAGMIMTVDPICRTIENQGVPRPVILLGPAGETFDQAMAAELASLDGFTLICGRYEGIDERVHQNLVDREVSVGDFILNGGEVAAMVILESVTRLLRGAMGNETSTEDESFSDGLLEYPQYTRPAEYRGWTVPEVLRGGNHARIGRWRRAEALQRTLDRRPELIEARGGLTESESDLLAELDDLDG